MLYRGPPQNPPNAKKTNFSLSCHRCQENVFHGLSTNQKPRNLSRDTKTTNQRAPFRLDRTLKTKRTQMAFEGSAMFMSSAMPPWGVAPSSGGWPRPLAVRHTFKNKLKQTSTVLQHQAVGQGQGSQVHLHLGVGGDGVG